MEGTMLTQTPTGVRLSSAPALYGNVHAHSEPLSSSQVGNFVLLIDSSPTIQRVIEMTLLRERYRVRSFCDGIDAMRWFAGPDACIPDLMLVELDLPKMDGCDVLQKFKTKARFSNTACILLSQREQVPEQFKGRGAVLRKPFTAQELVGAVRGSIARIHA